MGADMRKPLGRFGRPMKTTEEIIEEFQNEMDELEYEEYDSESVDEYGEDFSENAEQGEYEELEEYEEPDEYEELEDYEESEESDEYEEPEESDEYEELDDYEEPEESDEYEELDDYEEPEESDEYEELEDYEEPDELEEYEESETSEDYKEPEEYEESGEYQSSDEYGDSQEYEEPETYFAQEDYGASELTLSSRRRNRRADEEDGEDKGDRILDRFILIAGAAVLLMALITGGVFIGMRFRGSEQQAYQQVGAQLADMDLIGGQGLAAIADARQTYIAMQLAQATPEPVPTQPPERYEEQDYIPDIQVQMNFSSIEKDLKIKFVNKETGKLISNVPFSVTITDPDGSAVMWSDDDMDGIIYKKNLTPGQYRLVMNTLTDEKYKSYGLVTAEQKTEVKKEIEYKKVDVSDEVKTESQVNVALEDTKINQTVVENYLQDTVAWVESTTTMVTYAEVAKSDIPDPMTLAMSGSFVRLSRLLSQPPTELSTDSAGALTADPGGAPTADPGGTTSTEPPVPPAEPTPGSPTAEPTAAPTAEPTAAPTAEPTAVPTAEPTAPPTPTPAPTPIPVYVGRIDPASKTLRVGESFAVSASCEGVTIQSITWNSSNPAAVTVDGNGTVTAVAATQQPVLISYTASGVDSAGNAVGGLTASCSVTVTAAKNLKLDKATELVYTGATVNLTATLENGLDTDILTVESSDGNIARAEVSGRTVTVTGVGAGTANITVKYTENNNTISAACTVTVKQNPRENRSSLLKDKDGNELYVLENNNYRQAFYADYYIFDKFFKKGEAKYTGWQTIGGALKYFDINGNAVVGEQVIQGVKYNFAGDGALITGAGIMGIDVSKYNGVIDWNAVKNSGVSYVIIRCGYRGSSLGGLIVDPMFHSNIKGATDAGLKVGVYFFTQAVDQVEAVEEASMVLELIKNYRITYPVFLDVEASGGRADGISKEARTEVCRAFCQTIQNAGYTAGVYANKTWLTEKFDPGQLGGYKIWLAQYASAPTYNGRYEMWQYKSTGRVSGISGNVDLNLSYLGY